MIVLNGKEQDIEGGLSVALLLKKQRFVFPMLVVRINGVLVKRPDYPKTNIAEGDKVEVLHLISGG